MQSSAFLTELMSCYQEEPSDVPVRSTCAGSRCALHGIEAGHNLTEQLQVSVVLFFVVMFWTIRHAASALIFATSSSVSLLLDSMRVSCCKHVEGIFDASKVW